MNTETRTWTFTVTRPGEQPTTLANMSRKQAGDLLLSLMSRKELPVPADSYLAP